jgi:hypothetical protein
VIVFCGSFLLVCCFCYGAVWVLVLPAGWVWCALLCVWVVFCGRAGGVFPCGDCQPLFFPSVSVASVFVLF